MNNIDESKKLKTYISGTEDEVKTLYEEEDDKTELNYLLKQIDFIELDDDTDFHRSFINQLIYFIKSDKEKEFFDFKIKKNTSILDYIINYSSKFKALNKIFGGNKEENLSKRKEEKTKKKDKKQNKSTINNNFSNSNSYISFSRNKSNLFSINKSSDKGMKNIKKEEDNIRLDKENMIFIKKNFKFEEYETKIKGIEKEKEKKLKSISYYEDDSEFNSNGFEFDSIYYILKKLCSVAKNKDFSIIYNIEPNIQKVNSIFKGNNKLYILDKIQFDFIILNLKIANLIEFLIDNYSIIHSNSKLVFAFKDNKFFSLEDLNSLKADEKISQERIDIIGESGVNIFNEEEKCSQLLKYSKLIHNINYLIRENRTEDLLNLLDLLYLNSKNKKLILCITNGTHSNFINIKNNKFLQLQEKLSVNGLLIYRNKKSLFRTIFLEKLIKKVKKEGKKLFDDDNQKKFEKIIKESLESPYYEKVVKKLSKIEKKIKYIKTNLFNYFIKQNIFIELCNDIMYIIKAHHIKKFSDDNIEKLKNKLNESKEFKEFHEANNETINKKIYIINQDNKMSNTVEEIINLFNQKNMGCNASNDLNILDEKKSDIYKIIILFVNDYFFKNLVNYNKFYTLKNNLLITKLNPIIFFINNNKKMEENFNKFNAIFELDFNYVYNDNQLQNLINNIINNEYKIDLFQKHKDLIKEEKYYKYIVNRYINIFNKTIFGFKKEKYEKYEKIFIKISQDIQFLQNFNVDNKNILDEEIKNNIIDIINNEKIKKLINNFLDETKILNEIDDALTEFEEDIEEIKKSKNEKNIEKNENIDNNVNNNINDNKNEIIPNINNPIEKNEIKEISYNENESEEYNISQLESEINECENIIGKKDSKETIKPKKEEIKVFKYLILSELIRKNIIEIIKNEIPIVVYVLLQKSIIHQFEKEFIDKYQY